MEVHTETATSFDRRRSAVQRYNWGQDKLGQGSGITQRDRLSNDHYRLANDRS